MRTIFPASGGNALAAEDDGTHAQRIFAEVGNLNIGFKRAHAAGLVFADDESQVVAAGSENKTGIVLNIFAAHLLSAVESELDGVAEMAYGQFAFGADFAGDVDGGVVFIFCLDEGNLRTRDNERNGEIVVRVVLAEIRGSGVNGYVGLGKLGG